MPKGIPGSGKGRAKAAVVPEKKARKARAKGEEAIRAYEDKLAGMYERLGKLQAQVKKVENLKTKAELAWEREKAGLTSAPIEINPEADVRTLKLGLKLYSAEQLAALKEALADF